MVRIVLLCLVLFHARSGAEQVHAAVASNFIAPMRALVGAFEHTSGHKVVVSYGSSGKLYAQILHGAPYDVFLSADTDKPTQLVQEGLATPESLLPYARGTLVLWSSSQASVSDGPAFLARGEFQKLAVANPRLAPYGLAAVEVLHNLGLASRTRSKWVMGENIAQTFQFVASGNAELGFIATSQWRGLLTSKKGTIWQVDPQLHAPITQSMVVLRKARENRAAQALTRLILSERGQQIIAEFGYISVTSQ